MANSIAEQVHLRNKVWSLTVLPDKGACVSSCQCFGFPVMHSGNLKQIETGNIFSASCFPMVPYSNRIENGIFSFQGQTQHIQKNHPDNIFPIHGSGWEKSWQIDRETLSIRRGCPPCPMTKPSKTHSPRIAASSGAMSIKYGKS